MKPILFNTEMVKAILDGRKSCTRRIAKYIKSYEIDENGYVFARIHNHAKFISFGGGTMQMFLEKFAPYQVGYILYVRETWKCWRAHRYEANADISYRAGGQDTRLEFAHGNTDLTNRDDFDNFVSKWFSGEHWHPSIHMPKEASRIFLKVTDVRVERLQDITDIQAEGTEYFDCKKCSYNMWCNNLGHGETDCFKNIWDSTVKEYWQKWESNHYVWVIEFERCEKPEVTT